MSLDNDIKDAFERHEQDARAPETAWAGIESRIRRAHHQRVAFASVLTVAVIATAAVLLPRIGTSPQNKGFTNPSATTPVTKTTPTAPQASTSAVVTGDLHGNYRDDTQGWLISYDETWKQGRFEGVTEFYPPNSPSPEKGGPSFWVALQILPGRPPSKLNPPANASTDFEHRTSDVNFTALSSGGERRTYLYDWTGLCISTDECGSGPLTLQVVVEGTTAALWNKNQPTSDAMIRTLGIAKGESPAGDVHTRHGVIDQNAALGYDDLTVTLVRFLDARVEQGNAESFMTSQAKNDFAHSTGCSSLYENKVTHEVWMSYEVMSRASKNGQTTFIAILNAGPSSAGCGETVVVGTGSGPSSPMILGDTYQSLGEN